MTKVNPGDPLRISASEWNRHVAAADLVLNGQPNGRTPRAEAQRSHVKVKVYNDTGDDLRRGDVVELGGIMLDSLNPEYLWFSGVIPDLGASRTAYAVMLSPTLAGRYGEALLVGICIANVSISNAGHRFADLDQGEVVLRSVESGPVRILYKPTGTGEKECAVLLGWDAPQFYLGKTSVAINKGSSGSVDRWTGDTLSDSGFNDTVFNQFGNIGSGKWVAYVGYQGKFYAIAAEC